MPQFVPREPVAAFAAAVGQTVALKGHAKVYGDGDTARDTEPDRIVMAAESGPFSVRMTKPAGIDLDVGVIAWLWARSTDHAWDLMRRLVWAQRIHSAAGGPMVEWHRAEWSTANTPSMQGESITLRFTLKSQPMEPGEPTTGEIQTVTITEAP